MSDEKVAPSDGSGRVVLTIPAGVRLLGRAAAEEYDDLTTSAELLAGGVDIVVPLYPSDSVAIHRWLAGGRPPLKSQSRWSSRQWVAISPEASASMYGDDIVRDAASQLEYLLEARARGLVVVGQPVRDRRRRREWLSPHERARLSRRYDRPAWGLLRSGLAAVSGVREHPRGSHRPDPPPGVVWFAAVDWWFHNRAHSDVQLARGLSAHRQVVMVNGIGLRIPRPGTSTQWPRRIARKLASMTRGLRTPAQNSPAFHVLTPVALPPSNSRLLRAVSAHSAALQVRAACAWYGMGTPDVVVTIPSAVDVIDCMEHGPLVVNRSDLHSAFPEVDRELIGGMEQRLLEQSDAVVYVNHELMAHDRPVVGERGRFLGHGVDVEHFQRVPQEWWPSDIASIPGPRIGFFGGLDDYVVDFDLIHRIATELTDCHIVLIGDATCPMTHLQELENLTWLGMRDYEDIPAYGSAFDVGIMPWLDNEWIRYCNPIKLKEYLALGLPVVTTDFPELGVLRGAVRVAKPETFAGAVREALAEPNDQAIRAARRELVVGDTWGAKSVALMRLLDALRGVR